jgi:hypothetical protein
MNRFGDLFLRLDDGSIWRLDLAQGSFERLADDRNDFCEKIDQGDVANDWLLIPLVDGLMAAGKTLGPERCYGFVIPPVVGGTYTVENIQPLPVVEVYCWTGEFHEKIRNLPDGTRIRLSVEDQASQPHKE